MLSRQWWKYGKPLEFAKEVFDWVKKQTGNRLKKLFPVFVFQDYSKVRREKSFRRTERFILQTGILSE